MSSLEPKRDIPDNTVEFTPSPAWWRVPSVVDEVDRRGMVMLRWLLLLVAAYNLVLFFWLGRPAAPRLDPVMLASIVGGIAACSISLVLLQRRQLQMAAAAFVVLNLLLMLMAYGYWGLRAQMQVQILHMLPLLLAGTVLGRRALWMAGIGLCVVLSVGARLDAAAGFYLPARVAIAVQDLFYVLSGVLLATFVLDQSMSSLRESLSIAQRRGADLALKRDELQMEMQERERARDQLVHALKIENVGRLASGVAHDFNHLLALIMGYAGKGRRSDDPGELKAALQGVEAAARRAAAVTRRLLDFSRQDVARPQMLDAAQTIAGMETMLRQLFDSRVTFELDTGQVDCEIHFDPAQLELVLLSLAANAQQAMPDGGRFQLALSCPHPGADLHIQVRDSGYGMSEAVRARCLEAFFTTKPSGQGTGLGLAVTANLIAAGGGRIDVESIEGSGSCFHLWLPARKRALPKEH